MNGVRVARAINAALSIWLIVSAFVWRHAEPQLTNTLVVGAVALVLSLAAFRLSAARYLLALLSMWLFLTAFGMSRDTVATAWNNGIVALAMFYLSFVAAPSASRAPIPSRHRPPPEDVEPARQAHAG